MTGGTFYCFSDATDSPLALPLRQAKCLPLGQCVGTVKESTSILGNRSRGGFNKNHVRLKISHIFKVVTLVVSIISQLTTNLTGPLAVKKIVWLKIVIFAKTKKSRNNSKFMRQHEFLHKFIIYHSLPCLDICKISKLMKKYFTAFHG